MAELANIKLNPEEEKSLSQDLEKVLQHVEKINSIKGLDQVEPTSHPLDSENVYRSDKVQKQETAKKVLKYAPDKEGKFFKVPKVIDN